MQAQLITANILTCSAESEIFALHYVHTNVPDCFDSIDNRLSVVSVNVSDVSLFRSAEILVRDTGSYDNQGIQATSLPGQFSHSELLISSEMRTPL